MSYETDKTIVREERARQQHRMGIATHPAINVRGKSSLSWQINCDPNIPDQEKEIIWMGFYESEIPRELLLHLSSEVFKYLGIRKIKENGHV